MTLLARSCRFSIGVGSPSHGSWNLVEVAEPRRHRSQGVRQPRGIGHECPAARDHGARGSADPRSATRRRERQRAASHRARIRHRRVPLSLARSWQAVVDCPIIGVRPELIVDVRHDILDEVGGPMPRHGLQSFRATGCSSSPEVATTARSRSFWPSATSGSASPDSDGPPEQLATKGLGQGPGTAVGRGWALRRDRWSTSAPLES